MNGKEEKREDLFLGLIMGLHASAMQYLGKVVNPLTNETEKDLHIAKGTIDLLSVLEEKTRGNLNEYEEKYLKNTLLELRLNFVEEVKLEEEEAKKPRDNDDEVENKDDNIDEKSASDKEKEEANE